MAVCGETLRVTIVPVQEIQHIIGIAHMILTCHLCPPVSVITKLVNVLMCVSTTKTGYKV